MNSTSDPFNTLVDAIALRVVELLKAAPPGTRTPVTRLLTVEQTATFLGRSEKAVYALKSKGALPYVQTDGRVMFDVQDLDGWIEQNKVHP